MRTAEKGALSLGQTLSLSLGLGIALLGPVSCGGESPVQMIAPTESNVVVNVSKVPDQTAKLSLKATINGQTSMNPVELTDKFDQFGFSLPYGMSGELTLDATSYDIDGCTRGAGEADVTLPNALVEVSLAMATQSPRKCGQLTPCSAGSICSEATKPTTNVLYGAFALSPTDIWAVGAAGTTIHYDGTTWKTVPVPAVYSSYYLNAVWASGPNDVWAVGEVGLILRYNGTSWALSPNSAPNDLNGVWGFSPTNIWTCGTGAYCFRWNGLTWTDVSPLGSTKLYGVWGSSASDVYTVGASGSVLRTTNNGSSWSTISGLGTTSDLRFIWGKSASQIFVVGATGTIIRYDGGAWNRLTNSPTASTLNAVIADDKGAYALGNNGVFLRSAPPYDTWALNNSGVSTSLYGMALGTNGIGWAVGLSGYLGHFDLRP